MAKALDRSGEAAARIVAAQFALDMVPRNDPALADAIMRFLEEFIPVLALGEEGLHIRLQAQQIGIRRPVHLFAAHVKGALAATLVMNDVHETDGRPRTPDDLKDMALGGETRFLGDRSIWTNPYWDGRMRTELFGLGGRVWQHCDQPRAKPARLAWEASTEVRPWACHWRPNDDAQESVDTRKDFTTAPQNHEERAAVRRRAEWLLSEYLVGAYHIPATKLRDRGNASLTAAIAHYVIADKEGPRLPWSIAARMLGYYHVVDGKVENGWRTLYAAVNDYLKVFPEADRAPKGRRGERYKIRPVW